MELMSERTHIVDPEVKAFVFSLVAALGGSSAADNGRYVLGDDALAVLKDIKRWLRLYDDRLHRLDVARLLADANLVKGDLLEILATWPEDDLDNTFRAKIALLCVDLLTQLTWPIQNDELRDVSHHYLHVPFLETAQAPYKRAVIHHDTAKILRTVIRVGLPALSTPQKERSPTEENIIKVVLYLFRNMALIKQPEGAIVDEGDNDISRSATINAFHHQDVFGLILMICSGMQENFNTHEIEILDILYNLVMGIDVERLFMEIEELVSSNTNELKGLLSKEKGMHANYARHAPTRHNRFGTLMWVKRDDKRYSTVSGQKAIVNEQSAMDEMDKSKKWKKPRRPVKSANNASKEGEKEGGDGAREVFDTTVPLTSAARRHLRSFVEKFLDSSFNPLFTAIRRAIEREVDRAHGSARQYLYLTSWFLRAERARRTKAATSRAPKGPQESTESFALVAGVLVQENFVLLNREMQSALDNKRWQDLNAGMKCFSEILLTVQEMSESPLDEDQEIAENILSRIFYEQTTHDRVNALLKSYNNQGFGYLDACTELSHVFLRLLERYSKQNVDMQVRSRRRARKKKAAETQPDQELGREDNGRDAEDIADAQRISKERKFDFTHYAAKFISQSSVDTYIAFLRYFNDLSIDQIKRVHRFLYRIAFKMEMSVLLFRMDYILLFQKLVKGPEGFVQDSPMFKEWEELVKQLFRQLTKKMQERPELAVEILFSKIPATMFYLQWGYEKETPQKTYRPPAELEVKPGMERDQQIGVAVSVLINQAKVDAIAWVKDVLSSAATERKAWEDEASARLALEQASRPDPTSTEEEVPSVPGIENSTDANDQPAPAQTQENAAPRAPSIFVKPDSPERRLAMQRDKHLRLLMKLIGFMQLLSFTADDEDTSSDAPWIIPSSLTSSEMTTTIALVQGFEFAPPSYDDGKSAEDFLRRKVTRAVRTTSDNEGSDNDGNLDSALRAKKPTRQQRPRRASNASSSSEEGASEVDESTLFAPGGPTNIHAGKPKPRKTLTRRRRNHHEPDPNIDEAVLEERAAARRKLESERSRKIKSDLFVHASDDESDEERDREFFLREEQRRLGNVKGGAKLPAAPVVKNKPAVEKRRANKRKSVVVEVDSDDEGSGGDEVSPSSDDEETASSPRRPAKSTPPPAKKRRTGLAALMFDDSDDADDDDVVDDNDEVRSAAGKITSAPSSEAETEEDGTPPSSTTVPGAEDQDGDVDMGRGGESDKENESQPRSSLSVRKGVGRQGRRSVRAGFVVGSDEDE